MPVIINNKTLNPHLVEKIREISGENVNACMQCGTCGGVCPMYGEVPAPPRTMVMLAQLGLEQQMEDQRTYDYCASCQHCMVRCPRGLDLPKVMEAMRQITLRKNINLVEPVEISEEDLREMPQIAFVAGFRKLTA